MPYDYLNELKKVKKYYGEDPLQKRFSALVTGDSGAGKTFLLRTCRFPMHIDSFDPGGTKCLRDLIAKGDIVADTQWEGDDPFRPDVFANWMKTTNMRFEIGYFNKFATYVIDSATTFGNSVMNYQLDLKNAAGEIPKFRRDYNPQKVHMNNYIRKLMNLPCDFIMTGHLKENRKLISIDNQTGIQREEFKYRFFTTGDAVITIPLLFDELYVLKAEKVGRNVKRHLVLDSAGEYIARSRLKMNTDLKNEIEPDIRKLLKAVDLQWGDLPKLEM